jgi:hypothetical protein
VVPTHRTPAYLPPVLRLARELGCPVLLLCSTKWANAAESMRLASRFGTELHAVDLPTETHLPSLITSAFVESGPYLRRLSDTSLKRNLGLAVARMVGWERIVFMDDDITDVRPDDVRGAVGCLDDYGIVALNNVGFPDNSVVCHARREVGQQQQSFVGGGAMAVRIDSRTSFFPNVYNEDWLFLVDDDDRLRRVAVTGEVSQCEFDPFDSPLRARSQEFGDILAECLFALIDDDQFDWATTPEIWQDFLDDRRRLIDGILQLIPEHIAEAAVANRMKASQRAARARTIIYTPSTFVDFVEAWHRDRKIWRDYLLTIQPARSVPDALKALNLTPVR